jgi:hypothetical protein
MTEEELNEQMRALASSPENESKINAQVRMALNEMSKLTHEDVYAKEVEKKAKEEKRQKSFDESLSISESLFPKTFSREKFQSKPLWERALLGFGKGAYTTPGIRQVTDLLTGQEQEPMEADPRVTLPEGSEYGFGALTKHELGSTQGERQAEKMQEEIIQPYERASSGDMASWAGEFLNDLALTAVPGGGAARAAKTGVKLGKVGKGFLGGLAEGATTAGIHQIKDVTAGEEASLGEFITEAGLSSVLPGVPTWVSEKFKKAAPSVLRQAVKPSKKFMDTRNPANFVEPLEKGLITKFGGLEEGVENVTEEISKLSTQRDDLIKNADIQVNITDAVRKVGKKLNSMVKNAEIEKDDAMGAMKESTKKIASAKKMLKKKPGDTGKLSASGDKAIKIRKLADKSSKFNPFAGPANEPNKIVFNEAYRRVLEDEIEEQLLKKSGGKISSEYKRFKKELADLIPFQKAGQFRLGQSGNNYSFSLMDMGALGVGSSLGGLSRPGRLGVAATVGGVRRLTQTPGGAAILHSASKKIDPGIKTDITGKVIRSGIEAANEGEQDK